MSARSMSNVALRWAPRPREVRRRERFPARGTQRVVRLAAGLLSASWLLLSGALGSQAGADDRTPNGCSKPPEARRIPGPSSADPSAEEDCEDPDGLTRLAALPTRKPPTKPQREASETRFDTLIAKVALEHAVDPALVKAVIMAESGYNPNAVSKRGAKGLMQLMPRTAKALGVENCLDPEQNILGGVKYLRQLLDTFEGNVTLALAAYNAGRWTVKKHRGVPPFPATRHYIKKVLKYYDRFKASMPEPDPDRA